MRDSVALTRPRPLIALAAVLLVLSAVLVGSPGKAVASGGNCTEQAIPVSLTEGGPVDQTLHGQLCLPLFGTPSTVQLLVHGGTYNRTYWDFPYKPYLYSYVRYANAAGYATFNVDLLGTGASSHPHSSLVNISSSAVAMHQVITKLRAGQIGSIAYDKVIYVGHSLGVATGWVEAGTYQDIDAFIATGAPHSLSFAAVPQLEALPASDDPLFTSLGLDPTYLSLTRATRDKLYHLPTADPQAVETDWQTREVFTLGTQLEGISYFTAPPAGHISGNINVPVLVLQGDNDFLFCAPDALDCTNYNTLRAHEASFYTGAPSMDLVIMPQTGHNLNLHYTAPASFLTMVGWSYLKAAP